MESSSWCLRYRRLRQPPTLNIILINIRFPIKLGLDISGTVVETGESVKELKIGDEVFGFLPFPHDSGIVQY